MTVAKEKIRTDVNAQLAWDDRIRSTDVIVEVDSGGKVRLLGSVPSFSAKSAAREDAMSVPGVTMVENMIAVEYPPEVRIPSDSDIQAEVLNILSWDSSIQASKVNVRVDNGTVILEGSVNSFWKKMKAENDAFSVTGVVNVKNHLSVVPTENFSDEAIAREIEEALKRSINVKAENVSVSVQHGKVTLRGTVSSGTAFSSAYETALYTGGVTEVNNQLNISA
jgi:osmotically-inducible protein OsmY